MSRTQRRNSNWHHYAANVQDALVSCVLVWSSKHGRFSDFQVVLDVRCLFVFVFTALRYASALCAMGLCLPVCHKSDSTKTAKRTNTQTKPHDSPGTLVFRCQRSPRNSTGVNPRGHQMQVGLVKIGDFRLCLGTT